VSVVKIAAGQTSGIEEDTYGPTPVTTFHVRAPTIPFVRNVVKNEWLWSRLARYLRSTLARTPADIVHAQHVMGTVPSIRAGMATGTPVVATVRDYWPVCYWSDLIYDPGQPSLCPACSAAMMVQCVKPRAGAASVAAWPLIPYMRANLRAKRRSLARASTIIAVSSAIARDLRRRAPELARTPLETIPNPVDMAALDAAPASTAPPMTGPYVLYAGKLAINKGVQFLLPALERAGVEWPIVIAGDGPLRASIEAEARARHLNVRVLGWVDREQVLAWMRHATLLAFPSYGPESLSRVLIEAAALGVPVAAMNTGGTPDILRDGVTGLLASDPVEFGDRIARLAADPDLRASMGAAARADVRVRFAAATVVERVEQVYGRVLGRPAP
jgi:glycosyltransferase involved in cell wall biosynthesis